MSSSSISGGNPLRDDDESALKRTWPPDRQTEVRPDPERDREIEELKRRTREEDERRRQQSGD